MKKTNNSGNDDFSFSIGGDDELFPLEVEKSSSKDTKAPKGVKGYLKNVARSVVNLGVKTGKHLYPEAVELGEKFKPDMTSTTDPKAYISKWKGEAKKYGNIVKDISVSTYKDAKEAIKTGKFVKTEDERNNAEEMFGDAFGDMGFEFEGDSVSYGDESDINGDDSSLDLGTDEGITGATLNVGEAIVKTGYISSMVDSKLSEKSNATIVGASQTQIKNDRVMFAQNLEFSQEQHRQKMLLMTNIASNVGKIIEQGNVSIKAQMEFSAKQLAFSQDLASMVKEVRDAEWKQIKPKEEKEVSKSRFQRIFGNGKTGFFNLKEFGMNFLNNSKQEAAGGMLDSFGLVKEMVDMINDMGGSKAIKNMVGDMAFEAAVDAITNKKTRNGLSSLNAKIEGLPGVVNRKLNEISKTGLPGVENAIRKIPLVGNALIDNNIINFKQLAGWAHVDTDVKIKSGKYDMDPSEVHPFDNAAHKALTEVIPWQLAKIDSGINRTEQEFFNYKENKWEKISSVKKKIKANLDDVLENSSGYYSLSNRIDSGNTDLDKSYKFVMEEFEKNPLFKSGKYNKNWEDKNKVQETVNKNDKIQKYIIENKKKILHNIMLLGADYSADEILAILLDNESDDFEKIFIGLPNLPDGITDEMVGFYLYNTFNEFRKTSEYNDWIKFQTDLASYKINLTNANFESESNYFEVGAGLAFDASIQSDILKEQNDQLRRKEEELLKKRKNLLKQKNGKAGIINSKLGKIDEQIATVDKELSNIHHQEKELNAAENNMTSGIVKTFTRDEDEDKFVISDLKDSSTHGLVNNIYNLLLTGLDVYVKQPSKNDKQYESHNDIIKHGLTGYKDANGKIVKSIKEQSFENDKNTIRNNKNYVDWLKITGPNDPKIQNHEIYYRDKSKGGVTYEKIYDFTKDKTEEDYKKHKLTYNDFDKYDNELYVKQSDVTISDATRSSSIKETKDNKEKEEKDNEDKFNKSLLAKIPGVKSIYKLFNNTTQKINDLGNKVLGETFYAERGEGFRPIDENGNYFKNVMTEEEREEYKKKKKEYDEAPKEKKEEIKTELDNLTKKIKESKGVKSLAFGGNLIKSAYKRSDLSDAVSALGKKMSNIEVNEKTLGEYIAEIKDKELVSKLKNASNVNEQIQIVHDLGTDKSKSFADAMRKEYEENKAKFDEAFKTKDEEKPISVSIKEFASDKLYKSLLTAQSKILGSELMNIKDDKGTTKLKEAVSKIDNKVFTAKVAKIKDPVDKAKELLKSQYEEIKPFKTNIEKFIDKATEEKNNSTSLNGVINTMKSKALDTVKNKIGKEVASLNKERILSKDLLNLKSQKTDKTVGETLVELNDPNLFDKLGAASKTEDKINILLSYDDPSINALKDELIKFKKSIQTKDEESNTFNGLINWHKERSTKAMNKFIKNKLVKKLKNIKVGDKTLGEVIDTIVSIDPSFGQKIDSFTTMTDLAEFLLENENPLLTPYKPAIRELKEKHIDDEAQGGLAGIVGMGLVTGFDLIKKSIDAVKKLFNKHKKDINEEKSIVEKYINKDIIDLFGGVDGTINVMDGLKIDVELSFKDSEMRKASKQIEFILEANKSVRFLTNSQKRALKGLYRYEIDKEVASTSITNIQSKIDSINSSYSEEIKKYGDTMTSEERQEVEKNHNEVLEKENKKLDKATKHKDKVTSKIENIIEKNTPKEENKSNKKSKNKINKDETLSKIVPVEKKEKDDKKSNKVSKIENKKGIIDKIKTIINKDEDTSDLKFKTKPKKEKTEEESLSKIAPTEKQESTKTKVKTKPKKEKTEEKSLSKIVPTEEIKKERTPKKLNIIKRVKNIIEHKKEDTDSEDEEKEPETKKKRKIFRRKNKKETTNIGDEDNIEGNSAKEQKELKTKSKEKKDKDKENKLRFGLLSTLVSTLDKWKKDGFKLNKESTEEMKDAISDGVSESSKGFSGKISSIMDQTGLSNTKVGKTIQTGLNGVNKVANIMTKNPQIAAFLGKSTLGTKLLAGAGRLVGSAGATGAASTAIGAAGVTTGAGGTTGIVKILQKIFKNPKIASKVGQTTAKTLITSIKDGAKKVMSKIFPKTIKLNGLASNWVGWAALAATAIASFTKGMANAKTTFNIGRGMRPTTGMRLVCGLAAMLDGLLLGIPRIICKALGFKSAEDWFYSLVGKKSEKDALARYAKYNKLRSTIFGIDDPEKLIAYENRNIEQGGNGWDNFGAGVKRAGRALANIATLGLSKNNDEKDSALLGFQSVDIYKKWKEDKYTPLTTECVTQALNKLRAEHDKDGSLSKMNDAQLKKYLEQTNAVSKEDLDNNDDGEVDENSKAQSEAAALEYQNTYRKLYLEICKEYVLKNKLAWLTSHCTLDKFKKYTGKEAKADMTPKERAKRAAAIAINPIATLTAKKLEKKGIISAKEAKSLTKLGIAAAILGPGAVAIGLVAKKAWKERKHIGRSIANAFRKGYTKDYIMTPYKEMERDKLMKPFKDTKDARTVFVKKIIEIIDKYGESHIDEWKELCNKLSTYDVEANPKISREMAETFCKYSNFKYVNENGETIDMVQETIGIANINEHKSRDLIAVASGMIGWIREYIPEADAMCQSIMGMSIKRLAVKLIVAKESVGKASNNYEKYVTKRAELLGVSKDKLKAYESGLKGSEKATGIGRFKAGFKSLFSKKDADELDSQRLGFADVEIYKFWKQHKYDPIISMEKQIAGKYGKYLEIINKNCEDVEAQNKFIKEFITAATKYVSENKLAWLTSDLSLEEFKKYKEEGSNATLTDIRQQKYERLNKELESAKKGSRKEKKIRDELNRMESANVGSMSKNNLDLSKDFEALSEDLMKYDQAGTQAHEVASDVIHSIWEESGVDFYGDSQEIKAEPIGSIDGEEKGGPADMFGTVGSTENLRILQERVSDNVKSTYNRTKNIAKKKANQNIEQQPAKVAPSLTDKVKSKVDVMQSPINDFVINFKNELIEKLNILDEIHKEQVRHNNTSEEFYSALLSMVAIMAKSQGNMHMASQLDNLVKQVSK